MLVDLLITAVFMSDSVHAKEPAEIIAYNSRVRRACVEFAEKYNASLQPGTFKSEAVHRGRINAVRFQLTSGETCAAFDSLYIGSPRVHTVHLTVKCYPSGTTYFYGTESIVDELEVSAP